jgi:hypothetical protein
MVQLSKGASASVGALFVAQVAMSNHARNRGNLITKISTFDLNTNQGRSAAFRLIALDCLRGARVLHANSANSSGEYILTAHSLELAFKAFLAKFVSSKVGRSGTTWQNYTRKAASWACRFQPLVRKRTFSGLVNITALPFVTNMIVHCLRVTCFLR